jgi:hypothetical protein
MADLPRQFTCDVCQVLKREANHWFRIWRDDEGLVAIAPWNYDVGEIEHEHACGESHALNLAARLLGQAVKSAAKDRPLSMADMNRVREEIERFKRHAS